MAATGQTKNVEEGLTVRKSPAKDLKTSFIKK
jgi:hypothetical protein